MNYFLPKIISSVSKTSALIYGSKACFIIDIKIFRFELYYSHLILTADQRYRRAFQERNVFTRHFNPNQGDL